MESHTLCLVKVGRADRREWRGYQPGGSACKSLSYTHFRCPDNKSEHGFLVDHCLLTVRFKAIVNLRNWTWTESRRVILLRRVLISSTESFSRSVGKHLYSKAQVLEVSLGAPDTPGQEANAKGIM